MRLIYILVLSVSILLVSGCEKSEPFPPKVTITRPNGQPVPKGPYGFYNTVKTKVVVEKGDARMRYLDVYSWGTLVHHRTLLESERDYFEMNIDIQLGGNPGMGALLFRVTDDNKVFGEGVIQVYISG